VGGTSAGQRLTRCFCRFVTEPLFTCSAAERGWSSARVAYHLRTGYADVPNHDLRLFARRAYWPSPHLGFSPNASWLRVREERARWLKLACPSLVPASTRVISDSPALARLGSTGPKQRRLWTSTRSWGGSLASTIKAARDMVCVGGLSEQLFTSLSSSYTLPLFARSVCIKRIFSLHESPSACMWFNDLYPRNMYTHSLTPVKWSKLQATLPTWHPCKGKPGAECRARFLAATFE